jgi:hypothetical protein
MGAVEHASDVVSAEPREDEEFEALSVKLRIAPAKPVRFGAGRPLTSARQTRLVQLCKAK